MARTCQSCGSSNGDTGRYCVSCGARLDAGRSSAGATSGATPGTATPASGSQASPASGSSTITPPWPSATLPPLPGPATLTVPSVIPMGSTTSTNGATRPADSGNLPSTLSSGRYVIDGRVGQGGMSAVYRAHDTHFSNRRVAIKEMVDTFADDAERAEAEANFRQEADLLATLRHPAIPQVFDRFSENSRHYLVMEYIDGETLEDILERQKKPFSEAQVRDWTMQLCSVLAYLHEQNPPIIFRDLKPGNIMLEGQDHVRLIDFGIARLFKMSKTADTTALGTTGYASPEHYTGQTDARSDIYSLGATLHHLLTGRDPTRQPPFAFPPILSLTPTLSPEIVEVVTRSLQLDRARRYGSAQEVVATLRGQGPARPTATLGPTTMTPGQPSPPQAFHTGTGTRTQTLIVEHIPSNADHGEIARRISAMTGQPEAATGTLLQSLPAVLPVTRTLEVQREMSSLTRMGVRARTGDVVTDLVALSEPIRRRLQDDHQVVIWDAAVGPKRTCTCRRCGNVWTTTKPIGASVPLQCPSCRSRDWSKRRLFKCAWCNHEFESNDFWSRPEDVFRVCPSCGLAGWAGTSGTSSYVPAAPVPARRQTVLPQVQQPPVQNMLNLASASPARVVATLAVMSIVVFVAVSVLAALAHTAFPFFLIFFLGPMIWGGRRRGRRP